jgi:hypothetical protein
MTLEAPAKVNLTLRVLGRRSDGFHDIETLMAPLDLADRLEMSLSENAGVEFSCSDPALPTDGSNLVCKAMAAFAAATGREFGVRIQLEKHIPHGAGLGGGSSDAAAVLKGLNELLATNLSVEELETIAAKIGYSLFHSRSSRHLPRTRRAHRARGGCSRGGDSFGEAAVRHFDPLGLRGLGLVSEVVRNFSREVGFHWHGERSRGSGFFQTPPASRAETLAGRSTWRGRGDDVGIGLHGFRRA